MWISIDLTEGRFARRKLTSKPSREPTMMIPQRTLRNDFAASELKERVTACRKRLRARRFVQKPAVGREFDEDSFASQVPFLDDESPMRESFLSSELSSTA